jgi:hypothetical protein
MREAIDERAKLVASMVRDYVREHFELRERLDITPLDDLAAFVEGHVRGAIVELRGSFNCMDCGMGVDVNEVRCSTCSNHV